MNPRPVTEKSEGKTDKGTANGLVAFVGAGPGDDGLLTVRAAELLAHADLVVAGPELADRMERLVPAQTPAADAAAVFDRKAFEELVAEIGQEAATETLALFVSETDDRLKLLRRLSIETDRLTIEREAHTLKSAAATFGLRDVAQLARSLERDAASITAGDYRVLLDRIEAGFASARTSYLAAMLSA